MKRLNGPFRQLARAAFVIAAVAPSGMAQAGGIQITAPQNGMLVTPGQTLQVTVVPIAGSTLQGVTAGIAPFPQTPTVLQSPPYQFSVPVPQGVLGSLTVGALALDVLGHTWQTSVTVVVQPLLTAVGIQINPKRLVFSSANGQLRPVSVTASFPDGSSAYVTSSPDTHYVSSNTKVAVVNAVGQVTPLASGMSTITVTYAGLTTILSLLVGVFPVTGDLNGDGAVDESDVTILLKSLNTPSTGAGDPRDLNRDGVINALDARILTTLCSRPGCATH